MSTIKISARSIDDLNSIYKKIKNEFKPQDTIKLNQQTMDYELLLYKNEMDGSLKSICDKVIDADEILDESSVFEDLNWRRFKEILSGEKVSIPLRGLHGIWNNLSEEKKRACYDYLCKEKELNPSEEELEVEKNKTQLNPSSQS